MRTEEDKAKVELGIFHQFVTKRNLPFDLQTARKLDPNKKEPDILCKHELDGYIAFELVEICDPKLAQVKSQANKEDVGGVEFFWTSDPSESILSKKLNKNYHVGYPVELLCYTAGRVVTSDDPGKRAGAERTIRRSKVPAPRRPSRSMIEKLPDLPT